MGIFDRFENAVEKGVNNAFSRVFRSGLKPVDINSAIRRAMEDNAQEVAPGRTIAPNLFVVSLSPSDLEGLGDEAGVLADEFRQQATAFAADNEYALLGPVEVHFEADEQELTGQLEVDASTKRGAAAPATAVSASPEHPIIDIDGQKWLLTEPVTVIGRGSEADIVVPDSGVSRRHLELRVTPTGVIATDLGSTNGTFVDGARITRQRLTAPANLRFGAARARFRLVPRADADDAR